MVENARISAYFCYGWAHKIPVSEFQELVALTDALHDAANEHDSFYEYALANAEEPDPDWEELVNQTVKGLWNDDPHPSKLAMPEDLDAYYAFLRGVSDREFSERKEAY